MTDSAQDFSLLARPGGHHLAYVSRHSNNHANAPTVVFLGGFRSDMTGTKALALDIWAQRAGFAFLRFDYFAHGASSGAFEDATIGRWIDDALAAIETLTVGHLVLIGSSMGGWIMLNVAQRLRTRLAGLVGIAAAPDFTQELIWPELSAADQATLKRDGRLLRPSRYTPEPDVLTLKLIEEGADHLVLDKPLVLPCPIHLLHGTADPEVPWQMSLRILQHVEAPEATLTLVKDGDHRLSQPADIARLTDTVEKLCRATQ
jgi:pimeloyl-ACP methyl ester carboxylesterase